MTIDTKGNSTSFIKPDPIQDDHPSDIVDEEQIQFCLDPKLQTYLAQMSQESGCWGKFFPIPFERASRRSWWDPTFDSEILEEQYKKSSYPHNRFKFRYCLWYMIFVSTSWLIYILVVGSLGDIRQWPFVCGLFAVRLAFTCLALCITYTRIYQRHMTTISFGLAILLVMMSFTLMVMAQPIPIGHFSICVQLLILIYTLIPIKLYMCLTLAVFYSFTFELLSAFLTMTVNKESEDAYSIVTRIICHIAIHVIGLHIFLISNVRMRHTFMKVGQSLLVRKQLELEKRLKENMIHSLMPPSVANWLLHEDENFTRRQSSDSANDIRSIFRPFNMDNMENVSILFADIVGFTKMSSNKSAEELVEILNNLFQRFDDLCKVHHCEKISTLGDCYYCVSGCPQARQDHAQCCVEMGLSMIEAIKKFDQEKHEGINMRVGIHTGTVLCGIVGTKRFKFDVWSNDVTLANKMESTGKPGMVHVSEKTVSFLNNMYLLDEGDIVSGLTTYFILGRKGENIPSYQGSFRAEGRQKYTNSLQLVVSPPASASFSPQSRPRVLSCDTSHIKSTQNKKYLSPDSYIIKANSLPSILDSENEQDINEGTNLEIVKTPTSTASSGKYSMKLKNWKIPKFRRKTETNNVKPEIDVDFVSGTTEPSDDGYQQIPTIIECNTINGKKKNSCATLVKYEDIPAFKESIDIKSYISHSRSDIGQFDYSPTPEFLRGGSYRSQFGRSYNGDFVILNRAGSSRSRRGRSPNLESIEPIERARSATVAAGNFPRFKRSLDVPSRLSSVIKLDENSPHSRKDSGIKSNSRRSSIQQIDTSLLNSEILHHRVSGYYTSSQSSMNSHLPKLVNSNPHGPFFEKFGVGIQNLRKQSDRQLIKCVQDNSRSQCSYFIKPPLSPWTLFFQNKDMEQEYRENVHHIQPTTQIDTLANSRFNTYLDVFVSIMVFFITSFGLAFVYGLTEFWLIAFFCLLLLQLLNFPLCFVSVVRWTDRICRCTSRFYRWNMFGAVLVSLPLISVVINFVPERNETYFHLHMYTYLLFVGLIHFCNFTQLNCWMKSVIATMISVIFTVLFMSSPCEFFEVVNNSTELDNNPPFLLALNNNFSVSSALPLKGDKACYLKNSEVTMNLLMLLVLVWMLNREFEIGYRLGFHSNYIANRDKSHVQSLKNQADYLIYNIVPEHVAEQLKKDAKYSENFQEVAIIFASIVNFNEMYDESFEGGREYLRVLNELIGDFDELLDKKEFHCVEKIKTIGSTFMAASGLDSLMRTQQKDPHEHLYALMDFAIEMQRVVEEFNRDLLEFDLIIRIGYNFGDVTAAVIGNTKLYYDVWGDAVNIASRMDSTGVNGHIQVGEHCLSILEKKYEFEPRGSVYVKGKDHMNVYLLKKKKESECTYIPEMAT
ncbi:adenylate cyclase type 9 [Cylas formicarius]|uniref:adenylate cyclase type 9 n=1 Tax=Cylas formicarius TaxID=197179 RepID=UPI002958B522|nr:adenylate cyclase type 9 [Cylas formicarius]